MLIWNAYIIIWLQEFIHPCPPQASLLCSMNERCDLGEVNHYVVATIKGKD